MFGRLLAATLLASVSPASGAAGADAPLPTVSGASFASAPVALSNGVHGAIISFESRTPTDWAPAIRGDTGPAVTLNAQIFLPPRRTGKLPAIIVAPGSGNIGTHHLAEAMRIIPGALHAFDRADVPPTPIPHAVTSTIFPTIYMTDAGVYFDPRTGQTDPGLTAKDFTSYAAKAGFRRKGVTIGSRPGDAEAFMTEMTAFFAREL